jgi:hypothetical protein
LNFLFCGCGVCAAYKSYNIPTVVNTEPEQTLRGFLAETQAQAQAQAQCMAHGSVDLATKKLNERREERPRALKLKIGYPIKKFHGIHAPIFAIFE